MADALKAVARVKKSDRPVHHTVVGDGPLRGSLHRLASELDLDAEVRFWVHGTGRRSRPSSGKPTSSSRPASRPRAETRREFPTSSRKPWAAGFPW